MGLISVDTRSRTPIWEQLTDNIKSNVISGNLRPGEQLPSVRLLAGELAINPNTIQKAYAELERLGVTYSIPGRGSFIADDVSEIKKLKSEKVLAELSERIRAAYELGITRDALIALVDLSLQSPGFGEKQRKDDHK